MSTQGVGKYFIFIKNRVTCWRDLAWCLEFTTPDIENIDGKHRDDKSRCMELLQQWHTRKGNAATIHVLMEALQDADLQLVVDSLKDSYPELLCTDGTYDITSTDPYRQVQSAVRTTRQKSEQMKVQLETMQEQVQTGRIGVDAMTKELKMLKEKNEKAEKILLEQKAEMNEKIQQLQETNKSLEARIEELLTAKQPVASGSQQKDPTQTKSDQQSMDKSTAPNTGVKQSVVQGFSSTGVERPWVKKVSFGGEGSDRGKLRYPVGVAVSKDNEVYIADCWNIRIQVFTMDGVYIREFKTLPGETGKMLSPCDVAVDRNDNLWVVDGDHVLQYSREGTCLAKIDLPRGAQHGITVAMATEQVIVKECDDNDGRLRVFNQDGSEVGTYGLGHRSPKPWWPGSAAVDGEGNILVTDVNNHCVHVLDREGNFKFKFGSEGSHESQFKSPVGICVDGKGNIIVADRGNGCVKMFDSHGRFLCYIVSGMTWPQAVAVSRGGDVVVTDNRDHTVSVWTQG